MRSPALLVLPLALVAVACGSSSSSSTKTTKGLSPASGVAAAHGGATTLATQRLSTIGSVLTNGNGRTLYVFTPEKGGKVACTGGCASTWPPLLLGSRPKPTATSAIHPDLIGTIHNPSGGTIVTYAGWPLHTYASDTVPREAKGQGIDGKWYMISPSGKVITKPISTSSSSGY